MKILLTGSEGMVGMNIREKIPDKEFVLLCPDINELNLLDYTAVFHYVKVHKPEMVIHAAGIVGGIQANIKNPVKFLVENADLGKNLILALKENGIKKLLNLGSSCMYPRNAPNPLKEEMILKGELEPTNEGYALAKIFTQRLCEYICREDNKYRYKTLVPCNLYGRWDKFDQENSHLIPAAISKIHKAMVNNSPNVEIWGDGNARREFMYAGDFADFIWFAVERFNYLPMLMNVGLGYDYSINEYYETIKNVIGYTGEFVHDLTKPVGMSQKLVDISKQRELGWKAQNPLEDGILKTYKFFLEKIQKDD